MQNSTAEKIADLKEKLVDIDPIVRLNYAIECLRGPHGADRAQKVIRGVADDLELVINRRIIEGIKERRDAGTVSGSP